MYTSQENSTQAYLIGLQSSEDVNELLGGLWFCISGRCLLPDHFKRLTEGLFATQCCDTNTSDISTRYHATKLVSKTQRIQYVII